MRKLFEALLLYLNAKEITSPSTKEADVQIKKSVIEIDVEVFENELSTFIHLFFLKFIF